jgi:hypothetical protein
MWEKVEKRLHTIKKVFPFGEGAKEVMLYGNVEVSISFRFYGLVEGWERRKARMAVHKMG